MRPVHEAIIHATATRPDFMQGHSMASKVAEIRRWHMQDRGWSDIGYHFLIDRDGQVAIGRPVSRVGAHVRGHNTGTIGIALMGGHGGAKTDRFEDHFTAAQDRALRKLLADLKAKYDFQRVTGHNQYAAKACPCFLVSEWLRAGEPETPKPQPQPQQPGGIWSAIAGLIAAIFGGRKT